MAVDTWHRYRDTLDSLLEGFQIIGRDWTYLYVNPAAAAHARCTPADLVGRQMWAIFPGIEETPLFATLKRCMEQREAAAFENLFTFSDDTARWFEIRVEPVPEGICVHSVDIQARKDAEAALREQESLATLGRMAGIVAHEVKNPLAGLAGALQILKTRRAKDDPEVAIFDEMLASIRGLDRLVQDLLVFTKPITVDARPVSSAEIVRNALLLLENDARMKVHAVKVSIDEPAPVVDADPELLRSVLRNLLLNAAQAMMNPGTIEVRATVEEGMCRLTVIDSGPGVPERLGDRIFEPFVTGRKGGTGLGLPISRRILRLHGGDLELQASTGGASFLLTIPLHG